MDRLKLAALGERLRIGGERLKMGGAEMGRKVSGKMKEILQGQSQEAKMVDEATSDSLEEPNWGLNLRICGLLNSEEFNGSEVVRAIKKKIASKNNMSQGLSLDLLEACAMNCDKVFSEVASEKVLDEMVRLIDNPQEHYANRQRALQLIEAWGESDDLGYLPVFKQTYMSLKARRAPATLQDDASTASLFSSSEPDLDDHSLVLPEQYHHAHMDPQSREQDELSYHGVALSMEEKREILVVTRNSIEILSSMLNSETQEKNTKDDLMLSMVAKCKESQPVVQRIIESIGDDESLLFEALNIHEELQRVLSKYEELERAYPPQHGQTHDDLSPLGGQKSDASDEKEAKGQRTPTAEKNEAISDG